MSGRVEIRKNVPSGTIILNRPEHHNPLSRDIVAGLQQAFEDFHGERKVRGIILTGTGETFCSGSDLKELHEVAQEPDAPRRWEDDLEALQTLFETMLRYPKPIVVAMNGSAYGLGAALVLASDLVIAHDKCQLLFPEASLGLSNAVGAALLGFRLGPATAMPYLLTGQAMDAGWMREKGIATEIVPGDFVWARAHELIRSIAEGAATSITMTKKFINESLGETLFTNLSLSLAQLATARTTEAALEGIAAYCEKRPPHFA